MARLEINRSGEMEVFARAVELGGFSPAARELKMTPSAVSKLVSRMEARLGARLINRSTRKLTADGRGPAVPRTGAEVLADLDEAERAVAASTSPRGRVRVNSNVPFGLHHLLPLVPRFSALYPKVILDLVLSDTVVDLMDDAHRRGHPGRADAGLAADGPQAGRKRAWRWSPRPTTWPATDAAEDARATWQRPQLHRLQLRPPLRQVAVRRRRPASCPCRSTATPRRATARPRASWPWRARAWPAWPSSTSAATSPPAGWSRCWRPSIPGDVEEIHAVYVGHGGRAARPRAGVDRLPGRGSRPARLPRPWSRRDASAAAHRADVAQGRRPVDGLGAGGHAQLVGGVDHVEADGGGGDLDDGGDSPSVLPAAAHFRHWISRRVSRAMSLRAPSAASW